MKKKNKKIKNLHEEFSTNNLLTDTSIPILNFSRVGISSPFSLNLLPWVISVSAFLSHQILMYFETSFIFIFPHHRYLNVVVSK
jgi:hypothetical protein